MCGRFYIDDEIAEEIRKIVRNVEINLNRHREVFPSNAAPILTAADGQITLENWLLDPDACKIMLHKTPNSLNRKNQEAAS